jgi:transcriptional regulator with XRE-family HTH domain
MITNERQRRVATAEEKRFERAIARAHAEGPKADVHPMLHDAMIKGMSSQLKDLKDELSAYEDLRAGRIKGRALRSLDELADVLIEGRIAAHLTQRQLAQRIGVPEQQIQRYEQTRYSGASLARLQIVAKALRLTVKESIRYHLADGAAEERVDSNKARKQVRQSGTKVRRPLKH